MVIAVVYLFTNKRGEVALHQPHLLQRLLRGGFSH